MEIVVWTATDFVFNFLRAPNGCGGEGKILSSMLIDNVSVSFLAAKSFNLGPIPSCVAVLRSWKIFSKARKRLSIVRPVSDVSGESLGKFHN